jgi:hypothetical protein
VLSHRHSRWPRSSRLKSPRSNRCAHCSLLRHPCRGLTMLRHVAGTATRGATTGPRPSYRTTAGTSAGTGTGASAGAGAGTAAGAHHFPTQLNHLNRAVARAVFAASVKPRDLRSDGATPFPCAVLLATQARQLAAAVPQLVRTHKASAPAQTRATLPQCVATAPHPYELTFLMLWVFEDTAAAAATTTAAAGTLSAAAAAAAATGTAAGFGAAVCGGCCRQWWAWWQHSTGSERC